MGRPLLAGAGDSLGFPSGLLVLAAGPYRFVSLGTELFVGPILPDSFGILEGS